MDAKKIILPALLALIAGCGKFSGTEAPAVGDDGLVPLNVCVPDNLTKVTDISGEDAVGSLQVFVFDSAGDVLEAYGSGTGSSLTINVSVGTKLIAAVVNAGAVTDVTGIASLRQKTCLLGDNSPSSFIMYGQTSPVAVSSSQSVTVEVSRLVARIGIAKITNAITMSQYSAEPVRLSSIFLVNAAGNSSFGGGADISTWYNKRADAGDVPALLSESFDNTRISSGSSYDTSHWFYCYPNGTSSDSSDPEWSARKTRLVVEVEIAGRMYYYPVTVSNVCANYSYVVKELKITRLGSTDPDVPFQSGDAAFSIVVLPWDSVDMGTVTI